MSDRERWIVYPLLFLSLGASLRPKLTGELEVNNVRCESLIAQSVFTNRVGSENQPVGSAVVKDLETMVTKSENALVRHITCDTLNGFVMRLPTVGAPKAVNGSEKESVKPNAEKPKDEKPQPAPVEELQ